MIWDVQFIVWVSQCAQWHIVAVWLASHGRNLFVHINSRRPWFRDENQGRRLLIYPNKSRSGIIACLRYMFTMVQKCGYRHPCNLSCYAPELSHMGRETFQLPYQSQVPTGEDIGRAHYLSITWNVRLAIIIAFSRRNCDANGRWHTNYFNSTRRSPVNIFFYNYHSTSYSER